MPPVVLELLAVPGARGRGAAESPGFGEVSKFDIRIAGRGGGEPAAAGRGSCMCSAERDNVQGGGLGSPHAMSSRVGCAIFKGNALTLYTVGYSTIVFDIGFNVVLAFHRLLFGSN